MADFLSSVRFVARPGCGDELVGRLGEFSFPEGLERHMVVSIGGESYCTFALWRQEQDLVNARPALIAFLDSIRHLLQEISPQLGVTDPVSGPVLINDKR